MSFLRKDLGRRGEKEARRFLRRQGFVVLAENYECPAGEIDLICRGSDAIVFVEVKTRASDDDADPEINVTPAKQERLERAARHWLAAHRDPDCAYRFDVLTVILAAGGPAQVRHIVDAFVPTG